MFPPRGSAKRTSSLCSHSAASVEAARCSRIRSLLCVNEEFKNKADAEIAKLPTLKKSYNLNYFEAARRWGNRSILGVCEDFHIKADAKIAKLDGFLLELVELNSYTLLLDKGKEHMSHIKWTKEKFCIFDSLLDIGH